jgi:ligand-binding sensor domain-containing protein
MKWILCICMVCIVPMRALADQPEFIHLSVEEGLPGSNIKKIFQDHYGYIWLGVEAAGLCKYNGKQFTIYEHNPEDSFSLSNNFIWDIVSDHKGNLWISTENGLNFFHRESRLFYKFYPNKTYYNEFNNNWILSLLFDSDGDLWMGHNKGTHILFKEEIDKLYQLLESGSNIDQFFRT